MSADTQPKLEPVAAEHPLRNGPAIPADVDSERLEELVGEESFLARIVFYTDHVLRNREQIFDDIANHRSLDRMIVAMLVMGALFGGAYGLTMGFHGGLRQAAVSAVKVPFLLVLPLLIAIPALYPFNALLGSRMRPIQTIAVASAGVATTAVLLVALAPLSVFFLLSGVSYSFLKLFHVAVFFVSGYFGAFVLYDGLQAVAARVGPSQSLLLLQVWLCLYGYVGAQLAWVMRPFVGDPARPFALFRPIEGTFFKGLLDAITTVFR